MFHRRAVCAAVAVTVACAAPALAGAGGVPTPTNVVVVIEENHSYSDIIGSASAPYINSLAGQGALFTQSYGVRHPSQPNYLALFSGSTQGVTDDAVHPKFTAPNLYTGLASVGRSAAIYSQSMPSDGYDGKSSGDYMRKHNPFTQFTNVPETQNLVFNTTHFPTAAGTDYSFLPAVSFVIPDEKHDMHDSLGSAAATISSGDTWLQANLSSYVAWADDHNGLLIVTFDEDDSSSANRIPTLFYGPSVRQGVYAETIDHYNVLRTIEDMYSAPHAGAAASAAPIDDVWVVPEPASLAPALGLLGLLMRRRAVHEGA
jgi:hypothetical protein